MSCSRAGDDAGSLDDARRGRFATATSRGGPGSRAGMCLRTARKAPTWRKVRTSADCVSLAGNLQRLVSLSVPRRHKSVSSAASAKKTSSFLNAIEPHFLPAPTLVGHATAA